MSRVLIAFSLLLVTHFVQAQICGTPQMPILERVEINQRNLQILQRGATKYIPITFHLVAATNGTGRIQEEDVFRQLHSLNNQYADQDVVYYIDRLSYFDNDAVYNTPASSAARIQMRGRKDNNSINVYITLNADSGSGGPGQTLAYYDPQDDWIVSRKNQINSGTKSLAHELGHFFSLPHPHAGWDCYPYTDEDYGNPVTAEFTIPCDGGGGSLPIELQNGSNCTTAGDRICDTPPDYNIGLLHQNGCANNTSIKDKNGEVITPITTNYMSYYMECDTWSFTQTQKNLMNTDYFTIQRAYIRTGKIPVTDSVEAPVNYITPINGESTPAPTNILLDWEDTPGATHYLVMVDRFPNFTFNPVKYFTTESQLILDELPAGVIHYWRVWPYNESETGAGYSPTQTFRVGTGVGVNEIKDIEDYVLSPNPVDGNAIATLTVTSLKSFEATLKVTDVSGHISYVDQIVIPSGQSAHSIETGNLPAGVYFVMLHSADGILVERLLIGN